MNSDCQIQCYRSGTVKNDDVVSIGFLSLREETLRKSRLVAVFKTETGFLAEQAKAFKVIYPREFGKLRR